MLKSTIMDRPLLISSLIEYAASIFPSHEIVSVLPDNGSHRYTYADANRRAKRLANALCGMGIVEGDRVGTLAWNTHRHIELYYAISGMGAVCHTLNPRLSPEQLVYIINHAGDRLLFVDTTFARLIASIASEIPCVERIIVLADRDHMPEGLAANCYEDLIAEENEAFTWPELAETAASSLCYTSGTTGDPKGVLFSHRSSILHSLATALPNSFALSAADVVLPVVPMFHVNAWGLPYSAPMCGAKLVMPGPNLDGASLCRLINQEGVTMAVGVPSVWHGLLNHLEATGERLPSLGRIVCGGAAAPPSMIATFEKKHGVTFIHGWGMTETSPIATLGTAKPAMADLTFEQQVRVKSKQGWPLFLVDIKVVDADGANLPRDGQSSGQVMIRGPWITGGYFGRDEPVLVDGWFPTGDVANFDAEGFLEITDRIKDLIKSGGEWISSISVENAAMEHEDVGLAAVIGVPDDRWGERPLLIVVPKPGRNPSNEQIREFLTGKLQKWCVPEKVVTIDQMPMGPTGKILKRKLREMLCANG